MTIDELAMLYVLLERYIKWESEEVRCDGALNFVLSAIKMAGDRQPCDPSFDEWVARARLYMSRRGKRGLIDAHV